MNFVGIVAVRGKQIWSETVELFKKDYLKPFFVFCFFFVVFEIVYFSIDRLVTLDDPLFHIRFAEIIRERGLGVFKDFHWIYPLDVSTGGNFNYYNFLFYLALIPFTYIKPLALGLKLYGVVFFSLSLTILYFFLLKLSVKRPFLWIVLFLGVINFDLLGRFLVARSFSLATALLIFELYLLYKKKYWGIFFISMFYFFWHNATFVFPLIVSIAFFVSEKFYGKKTDLKPIILSLFAILISSAITFYFFPNFLHPYYQIINVYNETIINDSVKIAEGRELYGTDFFEYMKFNTIIVSMLLASIIFEISQYVQNRRNKDHNFRGISKEQPLKLTLCLLCLAFFYGVLLTRRVEDFFVFFSFSYIALSFDRILNFVDFRTETVKKTLTITVLILSGYLFLGNLLYVQDRIASQRPYDTIKGAAEWLNGNTKEGEIIFFPTWNWYTALFHYNTHNYYIIGGEPRILYDYNSKLYWAWWNISTNGYLCEKEQCEDKKVQRNSYLNGGKEAVWYNEEGNLIADYIKNNLNSRYVLTSKSFQNLNDVLENNENFEKVFTDTKYSEYYIYKIK